MNQEEKGKQKNPDWENWENWDKLPWKAWGSWFSWGSPVGLVLFIIGIGVFLVLLRQAGLLG
jgi:hypothetical protein